MDYILAPLLIHTLTLIPRMMILGRMALMVARVDGVRWMEPAQQA